ncbi:MAG: transposase [Desulfuromonadales bacterium]|nr:transposase [Desulfuromonadales bacterium]
MARALRIEYPGAFYHLTSRGNERKVVFRSQKDRERFLSYLESATTRYGARVHVYCLMSNHYHLLLETPRGNLSQILAHVNGAYTTYFNVKRQRAGHLFQGRYKAILVERDAYVDELSRYIHLNPVRAKIVATPAEYPWSSYRAYAGLDPAPSWLVREGVLAHFGPDDETAQRRYRDFVEGVIGQELGSPLEKVVASTFLGTDGFVTWVQEEFLGKPPADRELPALRAIVGKPAVAAIRGVVEGRFEADRATARRVSLYLCHRYSGRKLREIGAEFGVTESAVTQASRRMKEVLQEDETLRECVRHLARDLGACDVRE